MATKGSPINLIPSDFAPSEKVAGLAGLIKNTGLILFTTFLITTFSIVGVFIYYSVNIQNSRAKEAELKNSIKSLESTEQKLVLIKDRISFANVIFKKESSLGQVDKITNLIQSVPGASITRSDIIFGKNTVSISVFDLNNLKNLFAKFKSGELYKNVLLSSFNFSPTSGYQMSLTLSSDE